MSRLPSERTGQSGWKSSRWDKIPSTAVFTNDREVRAEVRQGEISGSEEVEGLG